LEKARISLDGLSVGDAFGEKFFGHPEMVKRLIDERNLPHSTWFFTDDTVMAMGIVGVLEKFGYIDQNELAMTFARNYRRNPRRGYGGMAHRILQDTVPFCLWCSARHIDDYPEALWNTVSGLGDRDTTCAIVGGIVSLSAGTKGIPCEWLDSREPLTISA